MILKNGYLFNDDERFKFDCERYYANLNTLYEKKIYINTN